MGFILADVVVSIVTYQRKVIWDSLMGGLRSAVMSVYFGSYEMKVQIPKLQLVCSTVTLLL